MKLNKPVTIASIFLTISFVQQSIAQNESSAMESPKGFNVRFRSVQAEVGTLVFINTVNVACDVDVAYLGEGFAVGVRGGVQHTSRRSFSLGGGGTDLGSPYTDIDFLLRLSSSDGILASDLLFGYTYHSGTTPPPLDYEASGKFKFGGEVKWLLFKPVGGFFLEANSTVGGATKPITVLAVGIVIGVGF